VDDRKFDDLTRFIGKRASRRAIIKGAIAAGLAAAVGRGVEGENVAEAAVLTRGGVKFRVKQFCTAAGSACRNTINPTRRCCYRCNNSTKKCCEAKGYSCRYDSDCCDGRICRDPDLTDDEVVKGCFDPGTLLFGAECIDSSECESDVCTAGTCCTEDKTCNFGYGEECCGIDEECVQNACCPAANVCDLDFYDAQGPECCDPYTESCTYDGCCPIELTCGAECCDGYSEHCDTSSYTCQPNNI
jgi:hypothetical protein